VPPSNEDINTLYNKAFQTMNKAIFLLSQWKASWDAAVSSTNETVADPSLADAVASAAAVVAAASSAPASAETPVDQNSNMVSLLLEADKHNDQQHEHHEQLAAAVADQIQAQVDMFHQEDQAQHHEMAPQEDAAHQHADTMLQPENDHVSHEGEQQHAEMPEDMERVDV